ncbi:alpha-methylacyl-CoA racemase [Microdochium nivale]|nr:alpha-methylacyl-CoA racemase [Microdochium nivale]
MAVTDTMPIMIKEVVRRQGPPPLPPPAGGYTYDWPTSPLQQFGFVVIFFFPALATFFYALRVYSRTSKKQFGLEDALVGVALIFSWTETCFTYYFMKYNYIGIHIWDVPFTNDPKPGMIFNFAVQVAYNPILALVKTSILLFLLKLSGVQKPLVRWSIHALNALNISMMIAIFIVVIFQCSPVAAVYDPAVKGTCIKQGLFYVVTAALTVLTDVLVLALPFWIFLDLKISRKKKMAVIGVFALGGLVTAAGVARLLIIYQGFFAAPSEDPTYSIAFTSSAIETNLAIITASAPMLRPLLVQWFPRVFASSRGTSADNGYNGTGSGYASQPKLKSTSGRRSMPYGAGVSGIRLQDVSKGRHHTEIRGDSPTGSEEEIMTYNGIMRTTNYTVTVNKEGQ